MGKAIICVTFVYNERPLQRFIILLPRYHANVAASRFLHSPAFNITPKRNVPILRTFEHTKFTIFFFGYLQNYATKKNSNKAILVVKVCPAFSIFNRLYI